MKPRSAKDKGMKFQGQVKGLLCQYFDIHPDDMVSRTAGVKGEDLILSRSARQKFPYSVECKSLAKIAMFKHYEQATANAGKHEPLVIFKQNRSKPMVMVRLEHFLTLVKMAKELVDEKGF